MTRAEQLDFMISELAEGIQTPETEEDKWTAFRSLVNTRRPGPVSRRFLEVQDAFLHEEARRKGIITIDDMEKAGDGLYVWQGDITALAVDAVVNAANSGMTGCYCPCHGCIDNAIHTFAGVQLRNACAEMMAEQGRPEPAGRAKITPAFNLPSRYVIHTVGPIVKGRVTEQDRALLRACYRACLAAAEAHGLESIAFCCISSGEFRFPGPEGAEIAVNTVLEYRKGGGSSRVVFNVFQDRDLKIYRRLLNGIYNAE